MKNIIIAALIFGSIASAAEVEVCIVRKNYSLVRVDCTKKERDVFLRPNYSEAVAIELSQLKRLIEQGFDIKSQSSISEDGQVTTYYTLVKENK